MSDSERRRTPVLFDIRTQRNTGEIVRIFVDVVFQKVPIKRPRLRGHWYFASTGANVELQATGARVVDNTPASAIEFTYTNNASTNSKTTIAFKPKADVEAGPLKINVSGPEATLDKKHGTSTSFEYSGQENQLSVAKAGATVVWQISMVRENHAISDFLFCNIPLWADYESKANPLKGSVRLLPSIFSFDEESRPLSVIQSFLMQVTLALRKKVQVINQDGIEVSFKDTL
jgi:hypothetical protein